MHVRSQSADPTQDIAYGVLAVDDERCLQGGEIQRHGTSAEQTVRDARATFDS